MSTGKDCHPIPILYRSSPWHSNQRRNDCTTRCPGYQTWIDTGHSRRKWFGLL